MAEPTAGREIEPIPDQKAAPHLYDWAVICLSVVSILAILGLVALAILEKTIPDGINTIGGVAIGALATMVAVTRKT